MTKRNTSRIDIVLKLLIQNMQSKENSLVTHCSMVYSVLSAYLTIYHFDPYLLDILDDYKLSFTRSFS